jgi:hypothetical protein
MTDGNDVNTEMTKDEKDKKDKRRKVLSKIQKAFITQIAQNANKIVKISKKEGLTYKVVQYDGKFRSKDDFMKEMENEKYPPLSIIENPHPDQKFDTKFGNDIEEKSAIIQKEEGELGTLIIGPLKELYSPSKFSKRYNKNPDDTYTANAEGEKKAVLFTQEIYNAVKELPESPWFEIIDEKSIKIMVSYGGIHKVQIGDYIMLDGGSFYRIYQNAFELTYNPPQPPQGPSVQQGGSRIKKSKAKSTTKWISTGKKESVRQKSKDGKMHIVKRTVYRSVGDRKDVRIRRNGSDGSIKYVKFTPV